MRATIILRPQRGFALHDIRCRLLCDPIERVTSAQVLASAQSLSSDSNHLRLEVDKFLSTVRAA